MADTGITNVDKCLKSLDEFAGTEWGAVCKAYETVVLGVIVPECMDECPVDTGALRASIPLCSDVKATPTVCVGFIGAGGIAGDYALRQHEDLTLHHEVGKSKFIEDPVMRNAPKVAGMVASKLKMRGGK
jgi:hypothetical protein